MTRNAADTMHGARRRQPVSRTAVRHARFTGQQQISIAHRVRPEPAPGKVLVRVTACCLCGSELRVWRNGWPVTPGHEIVGVVEQPGHALDGQRIVAYIPVWCGRCESCVAGDTHLCDNATQLVGWQTKAIRRKDFFIARSFYFPLREYATNIDLLRADRARYAQRVDAAVPLEGLHDLFAAFAAGDRLQPQCVPERAASEAS